jgi:hypothetical protein
MPNKNNPHGLEPVMRSLSGGEPDQWSYTKPAGEATALFVNDAVILKDTGLIAVSAGNAVLLGVNCSYGAGSTLTEHGVIIAPDAVYEIQSDASAVLAATNRGNNANLSVAVAGNTVTRVSGHQLSATSAAADAALDLKILELYPDMDNEWGHFCRMSVVINRSIGQAAVAGI